MREIGIDIETYSSVDLKKSGVYAYVAAPDFSILLFAYSVDNAEPEIIDLERGETLPQEILKALIDPEVIKTAYNANFERTCLARYFNTPMPPEQWSCTMIQATELGLPHKLKAVARVLNLKQQKDARGEALIRFFSTPFSKAKKDEESLFSLLTGTYRRHLPEDAPEKWKVFKEYCLQDVRTEQAIRQRLKRFPLLSQEQQLWAIDQRICDRGCRIDMDLVENAIRFNTICTQHGRRSFQEITGIDSPTKLSQLKTWIRERLRWVPDSLDKEAIAEILKDCPDREVKTALQLRRMLAKSSVSKYEAMQRSVNPDGRIRGFLQFYGANRSGRWAGRLVQIQNLPQNHLKSLAFARQLVKSGDYEDFEMFYDETQQVLSELIRTAFIPSESCRFIVADFSAIEARVIAWLAGEEWRQEAFRQGKDIYCASAAQMFKVPVEKHGVNAHLRPKGKIAELALGYGGSVGALTNMGALKMGLTEEELQPLVEMWRASNPAIVKLWKTCEKAAFRAVSMAPEEWKIQHGISFRKINDTLFIRLPSGRRLAYVQPGFSENRFGQRALHYMGVSQTSGNWGKIETWGGKLVENIVQAIARDCLAETLRRCETAGYDVVFHVHDEIIVDAPMGKGSVEELVALMCAPLDWAPGLILNAEGFEAEYYQKD